MEEKKKKILHLIETSEKEKVTKKEKKTIKTHVNERLDEVGNLHQYLQVTTKTDQKKRDKEAIKKILMPIPALEGIDITTPTEAKKVLKDYEEESKKLVENLFEYPNGSYPSARYWFEEDFDTRPIRRRGNKPTGEYDYIVEDMPSIPPKRHLAKISPSAYKKIKYAEYPKIAFEGKLSDFLKNPAFKGYTHTNLFLYNECKRVVNEIGDKLQGNTIINPKYYRPDNSYNSNYLQSHLPIGFNYDHSNDHSKYEEPSENVREGWRVTLRPYYEEYIKADEGGWVRIVDYTEEGFSEIYLPQLFDTTRDGTRHRAYEGKSWNTGWLRVSQLGVRTTEHKIFGQIYGGENFQDGDNETGDFKYRDLTRQDLQRLEDWINQVKKEARWIRDNTPAEIGDQVVNAVRERDEGFGENRVYDVVVEERIIPRVDMEWVVSDWDFIVKVEVEKNKKIHTHNPVGITITPRITTSWEEAYAYRRIFLIKTERTLRGLAKLYIKAHMIIQQDLPSYRKGILKDFKKIEREEKDKEVKADPPTAEQKTEFTKWKSGFCSLFGKIKDQTYDDLFAIFLFLYPNISVEDILSQPSTDKEIDDLLYRKITGEEKPVKKEDYRRRKTQKEIGIGGRNIKGIIGKEEQDVEEEKIRMARDPFGREKENKATGIFKDIIR